MSGGMHSAMGRLFTGATIHAHNLILVTLRQDPQGSLEICTARSGHLTLEGRSNAEVRAFDRELQTFLAERQIRAVTLRCSQDRGQYLPAPPAFKIEAMLQLIPGLELTMVPKPTVTAWLRRQSGPIPEPIGQFGSSRWLAAETQAIEMAAYVAAQAPDPPPSLQVEARS